ncbi:hypothetical protein HB364_19410 [Pseudoflavitalea sp. X16]|uniref:hypothetical protein n=1 Tax=Paraflavitalea devenefica TaxID=2716334 RepID=UPI00141FDBD4|nr:hypothetical protein [Paraflavitalea devenefica]NII27266.1 hypothetical protein [Paraflavitalea devenefica]
MLNHSYSSSHSRLPVLQKSFNLLQHYSFFIAAAALVIFEGYGITRQNWTGDFWDHAAVIKALSEDLLHPSHPLIKADIPHAFFSPYALLVAAFAKIAHLNAIQALNYAAFFNLLFFLFAFYRFCAALFGKKRNGVATLSLLLMLFLWGKHPFGWSGFYHFIVLHYVLPYPSTFAMALTFLILSFMAKEQHPVWYNRKTPLIILLNAIVFLTHPNTANILFIAILAMNFCWSHYSFKYAILRSLILILPAVLLSLCWPYFNTFSLIFGNNYDFQITSKSLYHGVLRINWPLLLILPGLWAVKKDKTIYFFLLSLGIMTALFLLGYFTQVYGIARLIAGIMLFGQFLIAYIAIQCLYEKPVLRGRLYLGMLGMALVAAVFLNHRVIGDNMHITSGHVYGGYDFLRQLVKTDDVILSDRGSNSGIPAFNGKVVASDKPAYWVEDMAARRKAVDAFFTGENPDSLRKAIIDQYDPDYIFLDYTRNTLQPATIQWLRSLGKVVYQKGQLELISLP